jgi:hypothetical protein
VDTRADRLMNRLTVLLGQPSETVEERAININADQSDHAQFRALDNSVPPRPGGGPASGGVG